MKTLDEYLNERVIVPIAVSIKNVLLAQPGWAIEKRPDGYLRSPKGEYNVSVKTMPDKSTFVQILDTDGGFHAEFVVEPSMNPFDAVDKILAIIKGE